MTLSEKLSSLITLQQQEVAQLQRIAAVDLPLAQTKLTQLQTALAALTPTFESNLNKLKTLGVQLDD
jgi:hypothetical protein